MTVGATANAFICLVSRRCRPCPGRPTVPYARGGDRSRDLWLTGAGLGGRGRASHAGARAGSGAASCGVERSGSTKFNRSIIPLLVVLRVKPAAGEDKLRA